MSDMLSIGASGVRAYQRALSTVSVNISNAANPNYVRRDLRLTEMAITSGVDPYHNYQISFGGVQTNGLARATDPFLEANVRLTGASLYGAETRARWADATENGLDAGENGVGSKLNQIFSRGEELSAAPFDDILRTQFIADIDSAVQSINRSATNLATVSDQIIGSAQQEVTAFNDALENLAETNLSLRTAVDGSPKQAALLDQRDTALAVLSERMDVSISFAEKGIANISFDGQALVDIGDAFTLAVNPDTDGNFNLTVEGTIVANPSQGSLSALITSAAINTQRRAELDNMAGILVADLNGWQASGETDSGSAGPPLLSMNAGAASLTLLTRVTADLALAAPSGAANGNIFALTNFRGTGGTEQTWTNIVGAQAIIAASAQSENAAATSQHEAARTARDNLSGVDLDREAADLIRFQQAYDASARVIQIARETMQSIFAIF